MSFNVMSDPLEKLPNSCLSYFLSAPSWYADREWIAVLSQSSKHILGCERIDGGDIGCCLTQKRRCGPWDSPFLMLHIHHGGQSKVRDTSDPLPPLPPTHPPPGSGDKESQSLSERPYTGRQAQRLSLPHTPPVSAHPLSQDSSATRLTHRFTPNNNIVSPALREQPSAFKNHNTILLCPKYDKYLPPHMSSLLIRLFSLSLSVCLDFQSLIHFHFDG